MEICDDHCNIYSKMLTNQHVYSLPEQICDNQHCIPLYVQNSSSGHDVLQSCQSLEMEVCLCQSCSCITEDSICLWSEDVLSLSQFNCQRHKFCCPASCRKSWFHQHCKCQWAGILVAMASRCSPLRHCNLDNPDLHQ